MFDLRVLLIASALSCLACAQAEAIQISCKKSGIAFNQEVYSGAYEIICKKETVGEDAFDRLRASKQRDWQKLIEFGRAFLPPNTLVEGTIMSSSEGRYGSAYLVTAIGPVHLTDPNFKNAIEAMTQMNVMGGAGKVTWRTKQKVGDYTVDFYNQTFPASSVAGGPRECMGFIRYIHGTPDDHAQRVIGTYCEIGQHPLDATRAGALLDTLTVHPEAAY